MLNASLGHIEIAVQIGLNGVIEMLLSEILESRRMNLKRRVVYKHIEAAKFAQRGFRFVTFTKDSSLLPAAVVSVPTPVTV